MKRIAVVAALVAVFLGVHPAQAVSERDLIVTQVRLAIGAPYRLGKEGPTQFDCSGLVWWTFSSIGLGDRVGGSRKIAREYQSWMRRSGLLFTDRKRVEIGDLAFWGDPAKHIGIVTAIDGKGRPRVTSALVGWGVAEVRYDLVTGTRPFSGWGKVDLQEIPDPTPTPPPPSPTPPPPSDPPPSPGATPTVVYQ